MQEREEVLRELLEPHRDPAEPFDLLKEVLDQAPVAIEVPVEGVVFPALVVGFVASKGMHRWLFSCSTSAREL